MAKFFKTKEDKKKERNETIAQVGLSGVLGYKTLKMAKNKKSKNKNVVKNIKPEVISKVKQKVSKTKTNYDTIEVNKAGKVVSQSSLPPNKGIVPFTKVKEANKFNRLKQGDRVIKAIKAVNTVNKVGKFALVAGSAYLANKGVQYLADKIKEKQKNKRTADAIAKGAIAGGAISTFRYLGKKRAERSAQFVDDDVRDNIKVEKEYKKYEKAVIAGKASDGVDRGKGRWVTIK